jgi:hypothetical protein
MKIMTKKSQVIKARGGVVETLNKGFLDLRKLGPITMRRSSEIEFDEHEQKYYIRFLEPKLEQYNPEMRSHFFDTYELTVEFEVYFINRARLDGKL